MSTINNSDLLFVERDGNLYQITYDQMSTLNDDDLFCVERDGVSYKVEAQYVGAPSGVIVNQPTISSTNSSYAPAVFTASEPTVSNATFYDRQWYKDGVEIPGATDLTYYATQPGVYKYEERWADEAGNLLTPSVTETALTLALAAPVITSPVYGSGVPDPVFTTESSAITNVDTVDVSGGEAFNIHLPSTSVSNQALNIINGVDFVNNQGLIWLKSRNNSKSHVLIDTERGANYALFSNITNNNSYLTSNSSFNNNGFTWGSENNFHPTGDDYVAWSFLESQGFFDIVTWNAADLTAGDYMINHNLGTTPGMIICKNIDNGDAPWYVYHKDATSSSSSDPNAHFLYLNENSEVTYSSGMSDPNSDFGGWAVTDTQFRASGSMGLDNGSDNFIAYVFADNPSNQIKCGSFSTWGVSVDLGFRPQWIMIKPLDNSGEYTGDWRIFDTTRGIVDGDGDIFLSANESREESPGAFTQVINVNDDGFTVEGQGAYGTSTIFIAIGSPQSTVSGTQLTLTDTTVSKTSDGSLVGGTTINHVLTVGETVQSDTAVSGSYASGTVSESAGNMITLSNVSGTWSSGMKIHGVTTDTIDYPDPINVTASTFVSSAPVVTTGIVNSWTNANAEWQLAHDLLFSGAVQTKGVPITGTGDQIGPDDFVLDGSTDYYVRVKYGTSDPEDTTAEWSTTTHFRTASKICCYNFCT